MMDKKRLDEILEACVRHGVKELRLDEDGICVVFGGNAPEPEKKGVVDDSQPEKVPAGGDPRLLTRELWSVDP
jgi:hypothetical protein